jgi:integrase
LRQILGQAVNDDRILKNPCRINRGGVERHPEQRFASLEELYAITGVVPDRYRTLVLMAGLAGLRQGELAAFRRADIDLMGQTVFVFRKRLRLESGDVIEDAPKTEVGRRTVSIPAPLVRELTVHLESFVGPEPDSYVLTSPTVVRSRGASFDSGSGCRQQCSWVWTDFDFTICVIRQALWQQGPVRLRRS